MRNGRAFPHTALIYADRRERNRLIESYLKRAESRWNSLVVLTTQPEADARYFRDLDMKLAGQRSRRPQSIIDVGSALAEADPARGILSIVEGAHKEPKRRPLIIGDWLHEVYGRFEIGLAVEEAETKAELGNLICCHRGEGFWSLDCKQITRTFELHRRALFGSTILEMPG